MKISVRQLLSFLMPQHWATEMHFPYTIHFPVIEVHVKLHPAIVVSCLHPASESKAVKFFEGLHPTKDKYVTLCWVDLG